MLKLIPGQFFGMDTAIFADLFKIPRDFMLPFYLDLLLSAQRRNIETFAAASQLACEGLQSIAIHQVNFISRAAAEHAGFMAAQLSSTGSTEENIVRRMEASKTVFENFAAHSGQLVQTLTNSNSQAMNLLLHRLKEEFEELRGFAGPPQKLAA